MLAALGATDGARTAENAAEGARTAEDAAEGARVGVVEMLICGVDVACAEYDGTAICENTGAGAEGAGVGGAGAGGVGVGVA